MGGRDSRRSSDPYRFHARLWEYDGEAPWVFVTVPEPISDEIEERTPKRPGFGSVKVEVRIGATTWATSLFPDSKAGAYVLPVKRQVRVAEGLRIGDVIEVSLSIAES